MKDFIAEHERRLGAALAAARGCPGAVARLLVVHERRLGHLQAERFAHLPVMLAFGFFALGGLIAMLLKPGTPSALLLLLFLVLLVPYIAHYFMLENAVQRWYGLTRELEEAAEEAGGAEEGPATP